MLSHLRRTTDQGIAEAKRLAGEQISEIQRVIDFIEGRQYISLEIIPDEMLDAVRGLLPEGVAEEFDKLRAAIGGASEAAIDASREAAKLRLIEIELELQAPDLTASDQARLLQEQAALLGKQLGEILDAHAPDILAQLQSQQEDVQAGLAGVEDEYRNMWRALEEGWDGSVEYVRDHVMPALRQAVHDGLIDILDFEALERGFLKELADYEILQQRKATIITEQERKSAYQESFRIFPEPRVIAAAGNYTVPIGPEPLHIETHIHVGAMLGREEDAQELARLISHYIHMEGRRDLYAL